MFKKTLIAAAIATTVSFGSAASIVTTTETTIGVEFAIGSVQIAAEDFTVEVERDYDSGDVITVSFSGATVASEDEDGDEIMPTVVGAGSLEGNINFLSYDGNDIILLVTNPVSVEDSNGAPTVTVSGVELIVSGAADEGEVEISALGTVQTVIGPQEVDGSDDEVSITFAQQLSSKIDNEFDAVVDVNDSRESFVVGGASDTLTIVNTETVLDNGVTTTGATYTVYADFSYLDADGDGELGGNDDGEVTSTAGDVEVAEDFLSAVVESDAYAAGTVGITITAPGDTIIPDQTFVASVDVSYTDPSDADSDLTITTVDMDDAGEWTLNGAQAHIAFLPFGANFSQSVTVSNTSTQTGGVDLVIYVGDDVINVEGIATVVAEGVTDISAAIRSAVADAGLSTANLSFDVIINAPDSAITVQALYYAISDGDRLRTL